VRQHAKCAVDEGHVWGHRDNEGHLHVAGAQKVFESCVNFIGFNYLKFATYSAVPFVVVLTLNVAVIYRTIRVSPHLRRSFGGQRLTTDRNLSVSGDTQTVSRSWQLTTSPTLTTAHGHHAMSSVTASQVSTTKMTGFQSRYPFHMYAWKNLWESPQNPYTHTHRNFHAHGSSNNNEASGYEVRLATGGRGFVPSRCTVEDMLFGLPT